jgi:hypothetical protein
MTVSATESVHRTVDRNGNAVFTVKLEEPVFFDTDEVRETAEGLLEQFLGRPIEAGPIQPIRDWSGRVVAYAIWKEK